MPRLPKPSKQGSAFLFECLHDNLLVACGSSLVMNPEEAQVAVIITARKLRLASQTLKCPVSSDSRTSAAISRGPNPRVRMRVNRESWRGVRSSAAGLPCFASSEPWCQ